MQTQTGPGYLGGAGARALVHPSRRVCEACLIVRRQFGARCLSLRCPGVSATLPRACGSRPAHHRIGIRLARPACGARGPRSVRPAAARAHIFPRLVLSKTRLTENYSASLCLARTPRTYTVFVVHGFCLISRVSALTNLAPHVVPHVRTPASGRRPGPPRAGAIGYPDTSRSSSPAPRLRAAVLRALSARSAARTQRSGRGGGRAVWIRGRCRRLPRWVRAPRRCRPLPCTWAQ